MSALTAAQAVLLNKSGPVEKKVALGDKLVGMSHVCVAAGNFTSAGGDATESITISGALTADIAIVTVKTAGSTPRTITTAAAASGAITVVLSGDPSTDHVLNYMLLRAI